MTQGLLWFQNWTRFREAAQPFMTSEIVNRPSTIDHLTACVSKEPGIDLTGFLLSVFHPKSQHFKTALMG